MTGGMDEIQASTWASSWPFGLKAGWKALLPASSSDWDMTLEAINVGGGLWWLL